MGLRSSKPRETSNFDSYLKALQLDKKKYLSMRSREAREGNGRCLSLRETASICIPSENKHVEYNIAWKTYLHDQLAYLKNDEWPQILLSFVKSWDHDSTDLMYQSQVYWLDFNNKRSPKLVGTQLLRQKSTNTDRSSSRNLKKKDKPSSSDTVTANPSNDLPQPEENVANLEENKINEMLTNTDLLEENFFFAHSRPSNIEKSIGIPKASFSFSHKSSLMNQRNEEEKSETSDTVSQPTSVDSYKNNTFINHVPVALSRMSVGVNGDSAGSSSNVELLQNIYNYKMVTGLVEKHFQSSTNVFNRLIDKFCIFFVNKYQTILVDYQNRSVEQGQIYMHINSAVSDLQQFIRLLYESVNYFYRLDKLKMGDISTRESIFNRDNMINFITSLVFNEPVYRQMFELLRINDLSTEEAFQRNLEACSVKLPDDVGIPPEFCLNEKTLDYYYGDVDYAFKNLVNATCNLDERNAFSRNHHTAEPASYALHVNEYGLGDYNRSINVAGSDESAIVAGCSTNAQPESLGVLSLILQREDSEMIITNAKNILKEPFSDCIKVLKRIEQQRSPIHKMKTIVKTAELINVSIQNFYKTFRINKSFKLDADQTLSIFIYIVARTEIKSLATHIKIIEKFTTNNVLNSISGYYATTLEACVNCIINMESSNHKLSHSGEEFFDNLKGYLNGADEKDPGTKRVRKTSGIS